MAKQRITELVTSELVDFLPSHGLELYNVEFVKEGKDWFLNIYIDRASAGGEGVGTDECELVSRHLSIRLDELDPIEKNYYLVVSSPGMDRPLITEDHYRRYTGHEIEVKLYKGFDGSKKYQGILKQVDEDSLVIEQEGKEYIIPREIVAKTKLAIIF